MQPNGRKSTQQVNAFFRERRIGLAMAGEITVATWPDPEINKAMPGLRGLEPDDSTCARTGLAAVCCVDRATI